MRGAEFVPLHELLAEHERAAIDALRDVHLFRARLADAFAAARTRLLHDLAADVLARELRLAPCDLASIVARVAESAPIVRLRIARDEPFDARRFGDGDWSIVRDDALAPGDAVVEIAAGTIDARLGVRLARILAVER